ncbi:MAG: DUF1501 domain-containing protein [Planctomycetaceae bacterium]|jgi:hypothetical protein|nr:DUF1501 domain-containing protein [Planctomycetaceae bacterium]
MNDFPGSVAETSLHRMTRRGFFESTASGLGAAALASLLGQDLYGGSGLLAAETGQLAAPPDQTPKSTHFEPRASSVIHLFMNGGPSQMDLFDPKEELTRNHGKSYFDKIAGEVENPGAAGALMRCPFKFRRHGESGIDVSELLPHLAGQVDRISLVRSMYTTNLTHEPALFIAHCGRMTPGLPSLGSWVTYGLGSENRNLPAYIVLDDPAGLPVNGVQNWQAGYLPPVYQGTRFRSTGDPVLNLAREYKESDSVVKIERDLIGILDRIHRRRRNGQPRLQARIASYELAARMQMATTDALDLSQETQATQKRYGIGDKATDSYGRRCLIARRLVERGVRFVQLFINFQIWDNHTNIGTALPSACRKTDQPSAALLEDLDQRGLLDSTLVVWGGEFGRLPIAQLPGDKNVLKAGRDHNQNAMVTWLAGGGFKRGHIHGSTDEIGLKAADQKVSVHDWHATILQQLGLHHEELYYRRNGLKERLTSVFPARVINEILA